MLKSLYLKMSNPKYFQSLSHLPKIAILFEDEDCIVVNKPSLMLSVPGRTSIPRQPRHIEWMQAIEHAANSCSSKDQTTESCRGVLDRLLKVENVPRKRASFDLWIKKNVKISDPVVLSEVWDCITSSDKECHKPPLDSLDPSRISVAELIEEYCGKVFAVHRLDCETSGALIFAKSERSAAELGKQFQTRIVSKRLMALKYHFARSDGSTL